MKNLIPTHGLGGAFDRSTWLQQAAYWARRLTGGRPHLLVIAAAMLLLSLAYAGSFLLRFEFHIPDRFLLILARTIPLVLVIQAAVYYLAGVSRILWAYVGIRDLFKILRASVISTLLMLGLNHLAPAADFVPRSVLVLNGLLGFLAVSGLFTLLRMLREADSRIPMARSRIDPVLIIGAGDSGETLLHEVERGKAKKTRVVGFLDDAPEKQGRCLRGIPILGPGAEAKYWAERLGVRTVFVAIPGADGAMLRRIVGPLREAGLTVKALPPVGRLSTDEGFLHQLQDVSMDDLLRRKPVQLDQAALSAFIRGKVVLVTGAAGSIGSELCRQLLRFQPARLVALDCAESPLHDILLELLDGQGEKTAVPELADVTDPARLRTVFTKHRPQIVFHAAALKHVPMCESHIRDAVRVNVGGTRNVGEAAANAGAETFIMISTDKAVRPSSMMGATKRVAELVVQELNRGSAKTRFSAVRFGNVLGSNGSVLRIFKSQLARGVPLTVTHPDMRRFFMTIPEAVQLVLQAAVLGRGEEVFELDMGPPVRIVDLAEDLIRLSGLVLGVDVKIEFTGLRPGEKLFEELYLDSELIEPTAHPQVFCLRAGKRLEIDPALKLCMDRLVADADPADPVGVQMGELLSRMVEADRVPAFSAR